MISTKMLNQKSSNLTVILRDKDVYYILKKSFLLIIYYSVNGLTPTGDGNKEVTIMGDIVVLG